MKFMKHLILISHGFFAKELKKSAEMILGPQEQIHTVSLLPDEGQVEFAEKFDDLVNSLEGEIIVLADLLGGTPCNVVSKKIIKGNDFKLYSGMNLPMIISYVNSSIVGGETELVNDGHQGIKDVNQFLAPSSNSEDE